MFPVTRISENRKTVTLEEYKPDEVLPKGEFRLARLGTPVVRKVFFVYKKTKYSGKYIEGSFLMFEGDLNVHSYNDLCAFIKKFKKVYTASFQGSEVYEVTQPQLKLNG